MEKNVEKKLGEGIVAYFDVLGYQSFLENNDIEVCREAIEEIFVKIPERVGTNFDYSLAPADEVLQCIDKYFKSHPITTFISDTIIFFFDFDLIEEDKIPILLHQILYYLLFFVRISLEEGFPMRGYVDYGQFYYNNDGNKNIIAGKTIVNCYQGANNLNFSGLILSECMYKYYEEFKSNEVIKKIFDQKAIHKYLVDTKNGECSKYVGNFLFSDNNAMIEADLVQYIFKNFHKHNKEINNEVMEKIKNTEKIMRHFIFNNNSFYGRS